MRIACLRMVCEGDSFPYGQLAELGRTLGMTVEYPDFGSLTNAEHAKRGWDRSLALLREADAFILDGLPLEHAPELTHCFHDRIASGARSLIFPSHAHCESLGWWGKFLVRYSIRPSWVKLVGPQDERAGLEFRRDEDDPWASPLQR